MTAVDGDRFRRTLGRYPTGVTVLSTVDAQGQRWGMTANSFASVSLDPPLVSVCVSNKAGSYAAFEAASFFGVSILSDGQEDLARRFATRLEDKYEGVALRSDETRAPVLTDCTAWLVCSVHQKVDAGDHLLLIGKVEACDSSPHPPLGYCEGSFLSLTAGADSPNTTVAGREIVAGWLIEQDGRIALARTEEGTWSLPIGRLTSGSTMSDALEASARDLLGKPVEPTFLYSVIDLSDTQTCHVYRAQPQEPVEPSPTRRLFPQEEIPWEDIAHPWIEMILRRYLSERRADRFGVYLNVGQGRTGKGRLAKLSAEGPWDADGLEPTEPQ